MVYNKHERRLSFITMFLALINHTKFTNSIYLFTETIYSKQSFHVYLYLHKQFTINKVLENITSLED